MAVRSRNQPCLYEGQSRIARLRRRAGARPQAPSSAHVVQNKNVKRTNSQQHFVMKRSLCGGLLLCCFFQVRQMHRLNSYSLQPKMGSDGYRSLRSLGDGGHVTRFGRQVTASPVPSLSPVLFLWKPNGLAVCNITFCLFSHIFERFFSITGIIRCVSGFNRHLPSRHQVAHFRSRHSINAVTPHSPPLLATPEL